MSCIVYFVSCIYYILNVSCVVLTSRYFSSKTRVYVHVFLLTWYRLPEQLTEPVPELPAEPVPELPAEPVA